jgi:hypothetical protein
MSSQQWIPGPRRIRAFAEVAAALALLSTRAVAQDPRSTAAQRRSSPSIAAGTLDWRDGTRKVSQLGPGYITMGDTSGAEMPELDMSIQDNTLLMTGGMFTVMKIRDGRAHTDYKDPGRSSHPQRTVAYA